MTIGLQCATVTERMRPLLERGAQETARRETPVLASATVRIPSIDPLAVFRGARADERIYWEEPCAGLSMAAVGAAGRLVGRGAERFAQIADDWRSRVASAFVDEPVGAPISAPVCLGGFSFDPARPADRQWCGYPDALLVIPTYLVITRDRSSWLTVTASVGPDGDLTALTAALDDGLRDLLAEGDVGDAAGDSVEVVMEDAGQADLFQRSVGDAVEQIQQGAIQKLVLAREVRVRASARLDPGAALGRLRSGYGDCTLFAFARGRSCFLGATPERLVRLEGARVQAACLAGSAPRGASEEEDQALGEALLGSGKERHEHALVVDALRDALAPVCEELAVPETAMLFKTRNIQHLYTPLEGMLSDGASVLELVERLHPTPAAGGLPRGAALALLRRYETFDRGWYAGPVGWVDRRGSGEFAVAIRSALLAGNEATLYAGCGIVAGSDPEREYQESILKLRPMLWALNGTAT